MHRFVGGEVDVLVSTMIVESGLDVPNANTMFVNRADSFGLAQLYQLRGRVGRSHRRAYCYLMVPDAVDPDAERRLQVLEHHTELGSGYRVALKDLELRGAGNLLGPEQSGFVHAVGFDMYLRMLEETVRRVMDGGGSPKLVPSDVSLDLPAYLPDEYIPSQDAKLVASPAGEDGQYFYLPFRSTSWHPDVSFVFYDGQGHILPSRDS